MDDQTMRPLSLAMRVDSTTSSHVDVSVFCGVDTDHRAHVGHLTLSTAEWDAINDRKPDDPMVLDVVVLPVVLLKPLGHVFVKAVT